MERWIARLLKVGQGYDLSIRPGGLFKGGGSLKATVVGQSDTHLKVVLDQELEIPLDHIREAEDAAPFGTVDTQEKTAIVQKMEDDLEPIRDPV